MVFISPSAATTRGSVQGILRLSKSSYAFAPYLLTNDEFGELKQTSDTDYFRTDVFPTLSLQLHTPAWFSLTPQITG